MNLRTGCIVYPGLCLEGAIFQPVLQDGTRNLSWAFLAWAWARFKGGMSIMSSEVSSGMSKVTQPARLPTAARPCEANKRAGLLGRESGRPVRVWLSREALGSSHEFPDALNHTGASWCLRCPMQRG